MQVSVTHHERGDLFTLVANVTIPKHIKTPIGALQYAYKWTNNRNGSWSIQTPPGWNELGPNEDWNGYVEVLIDMSEERLGLRSSHIGDIFLLNGQPWVVARCGFEVMTPKMISN